MNTSLANPFGNVERRIEIWGGRDLGHVKRLPVSTFKEFVTAMSGHPEVIPMSRSAFHALPKPERDKAKQVGFITPCTFRGSTSPRRAEFAEKFFLVVLDIDDSSQAAPFVKDRNLAGTKLRGLNHLVYHTASSTPDAPRIRVIVEAAGLPVAVYPAAVKQIAARLGIDGPNKESLIAVQPMYLPVIFRK